jgi:hypothetical protein
VVHFNPGAQRTAITENAQAMLSADRRAGTPETLVWPKCGQLVSADPVVRMLRFAIRKAQSGQARLPFALYVRNDNRAPRLIKLIAQCGALDVDDPQPAITVMMPDED